MDDWQLPPELQQIERDLGSRSLAEPPSHLRVRLLDGLRSRLRAEQADAPWQFALACVAAAVLWMNLSLSVTQATDFDLRPTYATRDSTVTIEQLFSQLAQRFLSIEDSNIRSQ